jgi:hypothetical protein
VRQVLTHEVLRIAIGDNAKAVREALRTLGKRVSLRWVYYLCQPPADVRRLNPYSSFLLLFEALWRAHPAGAEALYEDLQSRIAALRDEAMRTHDDLAEGLERAEAEHSDVVRAALRGDGLERLHAEIIEDIVCKRALLMTVTNLLAQRRGAEQRRAA